MFNEPIEYKLGPLPSSPVSSAQWEFLFSLMVHEKLWMVWSEGTVAERVCVRCPEKVSNDTCYESREVLTRAIHSILKESVLRQNRGKQLHPQAGGPPLLSLLQAGGKQAGSIER